MESEGRDLKTGHKGDGDPWGEQRVEMERASDREMGVLEGREEGNESVEACMRESGGQDMDGTGETDGEKRNGTPEKKMQTWDSAFESTAIRLWLRRPKA